MRSSLNNVIRYHCAGSALKDWTRIDDEEPIWYLGAGMFTLNNLQMQSLIVRGYGQVRGRTGVNNSTFDRTSDTAWKY